jgi:hypothetical protein
MLMGGMPVFIFTIIPVIKVPAICLRAPMLMLLYSLPSAKIVLCKG